jgi:hypothetical protein
MFQTVEMHPEASVDRNFESVRLLDELGDVAQIFDVSVVAAHMPK